MKLKHIAINGIFCLTMLPALASAAQMDALRNLLNNPTGRIMVTAYIKGSVDTWADMRVICLPSGMSTESAENVVLSYVATHPNDARSVPEIVRAAFSEYRCKGKR